MLKEEKIEEIIFKAMQDFADKNGIELGEKVFLDGDKKHLENPELCFLKENYLSFRPEKYEKECENIRLLRPRTYYDEVEAAARNILRLCRTKGFDFEDFLILTPDGDAYRNIIPVVFEKFGIDVFVDSKKAISAHIFVRFLRLVLEILAKGFSYERIMGCIRSGFFDIERRHQDIFENYLLASGVATKHYIKEGDFTFNPDEKRFDLSLINSVKKKSVDQILGLEKSIRGRKSAEQICSVIILWLEKSGIKTIYEKMIDALLESNDIDAAKEFETVWNSVMAVFSQFEEIFTDTPMTYQRVFEIFSVCTDNIKIGGVPSFLNQVHVYDTDKFISADKKVVMVLGVSENTFPKSFSEDGLISDAERELLSEGGMILAPLAYEKQYDEQFMVYSVLSSPKEMLFLSSPLANSQGEAIEPGEVFDTLKKIFPCLKEEYTDFKEDEIFLEGQNAAFGMLYNELCEKNGNTEKLSWFWQEVYNYFIKEDGFKEKLEELEMILKSGEEEPKLSKKAAEKLYGKPMMMSVSRLEKYNGCAFSYFLTYGLFIDQRQKASFEASDKGTALHDVLCKYFEKKKAENADYSGISFDEVAEETSKIVDESSELKASMLYETSSYYRYEIGRLKSVAAKTAWKIVKFYANSSFRPYGFEIKIGKDGEFPPYTIRFEDTEVSLRGFIDRMDICDLDGKKYFNIVDYKSSEKKIDLDLLRAGVRFQPLIYAGIVKENIKNSDPGAMLYMHMNDPVTSFNKKPDEDEHQKAVMKDIKVEGLVLGEEEVKKNLDYSYAESGKMRYVPDSKNSVIDQEEMNELLKGAMECAKETAEKIKEGNIEVNPLVLKDFDACKYCKFSSCCGINMD